MYNLYTKDLFVETDKKDQTCPENKTFYQISQHSIVDWSIRN